MKASKICFILFLFALLLASAGQAGPWSNSINVSVGVADKLRPIVQVDALNDVHIVFADNPNGFDYDLYHVRSSTGGETWTNTPVNISNSASVFQSAYDYKIYAGTHYVVFTDARDGVNDEIYLFNSTDNGATWTFMANVSQNSSAEDLLPQMAISSSGINVVWRYRDVANCRELMYANFSFINWGMSTPRYVSQRCPTFNIMEGDIEVTALGIHVVYTLENAGAFNSDNVIYTNSTNGINWLAPASQINVSNSAPNSQSGAIKSCYTSPTLCVAYSEQMAVEEIYYKNSTDLGGTWSAAVSVSGAGNTGNNPNMIYNAVTASLAVTYDTGVIGAIYYASSKDGTNFNRESIGVSNLNYEPKLTNDSYGAEYVTWYTDVDDIWLKKNESFCMMPDSANWWILDGEQISCTNVVNSSHQGNITLFNADLNFSNVTITQYLLADNVANINATAGSFRISSGSYINSSSPNGEYTFYIGPGVEFELSNSTISDAGSGASQYSYGLVIASTNNVNITNSTIANGSAQGIYVWNPTIIAPWDWNLFINNSTIKDNAVNNIQIQGDGGVTISNSFITNANYGIFINHTDATNWVTINSNNITDNTQEGVTTYGNRTAITNNIINGSVVGIVATAASIADINIDGNSVNNNTGGVLITSATARVNVTSNTIRESIGYNLRFTTPTTGYVYANTLALGQYGLRVVGQASGMVIDRNTIFNNSVRGISLSYVTNFNVSNHTAYNNTVNVFAEYTNNTTFYNDTISEASGTHGMHLVECLNINITQAYIYNNSAVGLNVSAPVTPSQQITVTNSTFSRNALCGVYANNTLSLYLNDSYFTNNTRGGIRTENAVNSLIIGNSTIYNNYYHGIELRGTTLSSNPYIANSNIYYQKGRPDATGYNISSGIYAQNVDGLGITNVTIYENNITAAPAFCMGIWIDRANASITNSTIFNHSCAGNGTNILLRGNQTTNMSTSILSFADTGLSFIDGNFTNSVVLNNSIYNVSVAGISVTNHSGFGITPGAYDIVVYNTTVNVTAGLGAYFFMINDTSNMTVLNVTHLFGQHGVDAASNLSVQWYVRVNVTDIISGNPLSAAVTDANSSGSTQWQEQAAANGLTNWHILKAYEYWLGGLQQHNLHTFTASLSGYWLGTNTTNVSGTTVNIQLSSISPSRFGGAANYTVGQGESQFYRTIGPAYSHYSTFIRSDEHAITKITMTLRGSAINVLVDTRALALPDDIPNAPGTVYKYVSISASNIDESNVQEAQIYFIVPTQWLRDNDFSPDDISLQRYKNGWSELSTTVLSSDSERYYFKSASPGFSYFAITGPAVTPPVEDCRTLGCADGFECRLENDTYQCVMLPIEEEQPPACAITCTGNFALDYAACQCVCQLTTCPTGQELNATTCACVLAEIEEEKAVAGFNAALFIIVIIILIIAIAAAAALKPRRK